MTQYLHNILVKGLFPKRLQHLESKYFYYLSLHAIAQRVHFEPLAKNMDVLP